MLIKSLKNRFRLSKSELISVLAPGILISSILFLFGPFAIYSGNISEFQVSLIDILKYYAVPGVILVVLLLVIGVLLSKKYLSIYVSLLFMTAILLWIQGNFLVWEYGLLDGQSVKWSDNSWRGWVDGALWAILLIIACLFYKQIYKVATLSSTALISLQIVYLVCVSFQNPGIWKGKDPLILPIFPPQEIFEFSSTQNVIHIILDGFQSDIFKDIISEEPEHYYKKLEGFTFFEETTGSFPTTYFSIPAMLSGKNYKNDIPVRRFMNTVFKGLTIQNVLYDNGYVVDLALSGNYPIDRYSNKYIIPTPYGVAIRQYEQDNAALMLDLVLFRNTPHFMKKLIYNDQLWLFQHIFHRKGYMQNLYFSYKEFFQDLIDNASAKKTKAVYKFIHLMTSHGPPVINKDCEDAGKVLPWTRENLKIQQRCSLDQFIEFLEMLKRKGIYESSFIILNADHGRGLSVKMRSMVPDIDLPGYLVGAAMPLMAIKLPYNDGPLVISKAQTMLTDIPDTISTVLELKKDFGGTSVFAIDPKEVRERNFFAYDHLKQNWKNDFLTRLDEYIIRGSVLDEASWQIGPTYFSQEKSVFQTQNINFGTDKALPFLRFGWDKNNTNKDGLTYTWALGDSASILLSLPEDEAIRLTGNIKNFLKSQTITIAVDGKEIGFWELSSRWERQSHSIVIRPEKDRPDISVVEFMFSEHRNPEGKDLRPLAVLFESITLNKLESAN